MATTSMEPVNDRTVGIYTYRVRRMDEFFGVAVRQNDAAGRLARWSDSTSPSRPRPAPHLPARSSPGFKPLPGDESKGRAGRHQEQTRSPQEPVCPTNFV